MIRRLVVDASVVVDLIGRLRPEAIETLRFATDTAVAAPALLDMDVLQVLRKLASPGRSRCCCAE